MKVAKWGNSLAVRLPADLVETLGLKEGDEIELVSARPGTLQAVRTQSATEWLDAVEALGPLVPVDFKYDRQDAYPARRGGRAE